ncbi:MAG: purine-nucleoside phosphorylase [Alkalispirochaetaceae bacterium]
MSVHIGAKKGEIAETILLPGDPLRAKFVAENYLEEPVLYNEVRGMYGFTGRYKGAAVSVQGTGMGMPSHAIYVNELFEEYGVQRAIRIGSCGSIQEQIGMRELLIAIGASTDSSMNRIRFNGLDFSATASFDLVERAVAAAREMGLSYHVGNILSSDSFYQPDPESWKLWARYGVMAIEMEANALYTLAAYYGREALALLTVSDHILKGEELSAEDRQTSFREMMEVALSLA